MSITDSEVFLSLGSAICVFICSGVVAIYREATLATFLCHDWSTRNKRDNMCGDQ